MESLDSLELWDAGLIRGLAQVTSEMHIRSLAWERHIPLGSQKKKNSDMVKYLICLTFLHMTNIHSELSYKKSYLNMQKDPAKSENWK